MITTIIPILNEEKVLLEKSSFYTALAKGTRLIFVDGGSSDRSVEIAKNYGQVLTGKKGRALQMNYGAKAAGTEVLLFLHADTEIAPHLLKMAERQIKLNGCQGGCFTQRIDKAGLIFRCIENFGNLRARHTKVLYGDQGIFVKKDVFFALGGFPEVPLMEDVLFTKKLRQRGKIAVLPDKIITSSRRWAQNGVIKTTLLYSCLNILFWLNFPLAKIKRFYADLR